MRRIRKIKLDSILLSCPSCQCVAAVVLDREGKSLPYSSYPVPREGALAIVTDVGAGSDGRRCAFDEQRVKRTAKSCGPDAPMAGVKSAVILSHHAGDGDKQALVSPGRARNKL